MAKTISKKSDDVKEINFDLMNYVEVHGIIKNVIKITEKMASYNLEIPVETPNGKISKNWFKLVEFNPEINFEVGDTVGVIGMLDTNRFEVADGKSVFENRIVATTIKEI